MANISKAQAANSVVGHIQRTAEKALAEGWDVEPFRRHWEAPESMVSHVLYRVALSLGDDGIAFCPGKSLGSLDTTYSDEPNESDQV